MPRVSIHGTNKSYEVNENEILYYALSERGEELPHGCLSGSCGACRIEVMEGQDNLDPAGIVESNTVEALIDEYTKTRGEEFIKDKTVRLSCRAKIQGDVSFKPLK